MAIQTLAIHGSFFENKPMREMLSLMFKGKTIGFPNEATDAYFSPDMLVVEVYVYFKFLSFCQVW